MTRPERRIRAMTESDVSRVTSIDLGCSLAVAVIVVVVCLRLGGFSFFAPWLIALPIVMFVAGLIRGGTPGRIIVKGVSSERIPADAACSRCCSKPAHRSRGDTGNRGTGSRRNRHSASVH